MYMNMRKMKDLISLSIGMDQTIIYRPQDKSVYLKIILHISQSKHMSVYSYGSDYNLQASRLKCVFEKYFTYFSIKTHVVGTQKKVSYETVLLSTQNTCLSR